MGSLYCCWCSKITCVFASFPGRRTVDAKKTQTPSILGETMAVCPKETHVLTLPSSNARVKDGRYSAILQLHENETPDVRRIGWQVISLDNFTGYKLEKSPWTRPQCCCNPQIPGLWWPLSEPLIASKFHVLPLPSSSHRPARLLWINTRIGGRSLPLR